MQGPRGPHHRLLTVFTVVMNWRETWAPKASAASKANAVSRCATTSTYWVPKTLTFLQYLLVLIRERPSWRDGFRWWAAARSHVATQRAYRLPAAGRNARRGTCNRHNVDRTLPVVDACSPNAMHIDRCDRQRSRPLLKHGMGSQFLV